MLKLMNRIFSPLVAVVAGTLIVGLMTVIISSEQSVQPLRDQYWANQIVSAPLVKGTTFSQTVSIPAGLAGKEFLLALFFGCRETSCSGSVEVQLVQGDHFQVHSSPVLAPSPTVRHQFPFSGFSEGSAVLEIKGLSKRDRNAPGLLYTLEAGENSLNGPDLPSDAYLSLEWFKVLEGEQKFATAFPNNWVQLLWLLPFVGVVALAWISVLEGAADRIARSD